MVTQVGEEPEDMYGLTRKSSTASKLGSQNPKGHLGKGQSPRSKKASATGNSNVPAKRVKAKTAEGTKKGRQGIASQKKASR